MGIPGTGICAPLLWVGKVSRDTEENERRTFGGGGENSKKIG